MDLDREAAPEFIVQVSMAHECSLMVADGKARGP